MSTTDDIAYKKLPVSKLKSLLSANGVIIPHVKDQPKEYYIKLYEDHILKESVKSTESDEIDDQSESKSSHSAEEEPAVAIEPQYIYQQTFNKVGATHINTHNENKHDDTRLAASNLRRKVLYLVPLLLAILVSLGMMCTVRDTYSNAAVCHSVQRVIHVLSLGLYEHNSGAADY